jgi:hypothetical protein
MRYKLHDRASKIRTFGRLRIEPLEPRRLLAGDVAATFDSGALALAGDAVGNQLLISAGASPGELLITGQNGTTINGTHQQIFSGVTDFTATLGDGDDRLELTAALENTSFSLDGGAGNDILKLSGANLTSGDNYIYGGSGDDTITLVNTTIESAYSVLNIEGDTNLEGYVGATGNDIIRLNNTHIINQGDPFSSGAAVYIYGEINIFADVVGGNDDISVKNTTIDSLGSEQSNPSLVIYGEFNRNSRQVGGNDRIVVDDLTINADGSTYGATTDVSIVGEYNVADSADSVLTGGNDDIRVTGLSINLSGNGIVYDDDGNIYGSASGGGLSVIGDWTEVYANAVAYSQPVTTNLVSEIDGGNDRIVVRDTQVSVSNSYISGFTIYVTGDINRSSAFATNDVIDYPAQASALSLITGGNDDIRIINTNVAVEAESGGVPQVTLLVQGDSNQSGATTQTYRDHVNLTAQSEARVDGGNDSIYVQQVALSATGEEWNAADYVAGVIIAGETNEAVFRGNQATSRSAVGGGSDDLRVTNLSVFTTPFDDMLGTTIEVYGERIIDHGYENGEIGVGVGNDTIVLRNWNISGAANQTTIDAGEGDDTVTMAYLALDQVYAQLGSGNDTATVTDNNFHLEAVFDGDDGLDRIKLRRNVGVSDVQNFELQS